MMSEVVTKEFVKVKRLLGDFQVSSAIKENRVLRDY
jgi:hypothetical protein